ncbi:p53-induced death domain-containing protein 1 isoform X2 [Oryctolagus cuniculus]|uniref:p53-induced death domain-containing protein 1 isoform X2 n=1 Tax=Oryctolagus cuniculus TaxID=9986 RepID=UPI00387A73C1
MATVAEGLEPEAAATGDAAAAAAVGAGPGAAPLLAGKQLNLDLYPAGCQRLLHLCAQQPTQLLQVEFLRLSTHEDPGLLEAALARVPARLPRLRSLVLKGGQRRDMLGACLPGTLTTLPASLSGLGRLAHLDLSFNSLRTLPACVPHMRSLDALLLSHNRLSELPEALGALPALTFLTVTHNRLRALPATLGALSTLQRLDLSENLLDSLPAAIGGLSRLSELNLASNALQSVPASLARLRCLRLLVLHSNRLTSVPADLAGLPLLAQLDLRDNQLRAVPPELLDAPFVRLQGNPLGEAPAASPSPPGTPMDPEMPRLRLTSDAGSFPVTPWGCSVTLAHGVRLLFPAGATTAPVTIHYQLWLPQPGLVSLGPHDSLLSSVLELWPHGLTFRQDVSLWLLVVPPRTQLCREVVVRTRSDGSWSDLETFLEEEAPKRLWARCQVPHFSWFLVVLRPVSDACLVPPEGTLLCSSGHPGVKVTFPPGATQEPRHVSMQVLRMAGRELRALLGEPGAAVSPLLRLSQSGPTSFLRPVTVQLPLPPGLTGLDLDRSRLHLLHRAPPEATWDDITAAVALEVTHLYARFQVTHFSWSVPPPRPQPHPCVPSPWSLLLVSPPAPGHCSWSAPPSPWSLLLFSPPAPGHCSWSAPPAPSAPPPSAQPPAHPPPRYWLWYTTKARVGDLARKAWERLRLHRVNLIALQRRRDPEQVLLQCLPRNKVDATLQRLLERYRGPEPSDTVEVFEGEKFFAAFERGIEVDADRPDCVEGRICFVFYSHLKNVKEVYVTTALDREAQAVRGQVSFYRGSVPTEVPKEAARQRKGADALWMATLPLKLPANLLSVAGRLGPDWPTVALHLGLPYGELQRIRHDFRDDLDGQTRHMLFSWAERQAGQPGAAGLLVRALEQSDRRDVAEEVRAVLDLGHRKYQDSIRRTGLAPEDPPLPGPPASQALA